MEDDEAREMVAKFLRDLQAKGFFISSNDGYIFLFTNDGHLIDSIAVG